jgi:hypothetical protein
MDGRGLGASRRAIAVATLAPTNNPSRRCRTSWHIVWWPGTKRSRSFVPFVQRGIGTKTSGRTNLKIALLLGANAPDFRTAPLLVLPLRWPKIVDYRLTGQLRRRQFHCVDSLLYAEWPRTLLASIPASENASSAFCRRLWSTPPVTNRCA